jgi:hypothetical protein
MNLLKKQINTLRKIQGFPISFHCLDKIIHCMANKPLAHKRRDGG